MGFASWLPQKLLAPESRSELSQQTDDRRTKPGQHPAPVLTLLLVGGFVALAVGVLVFGGGVYGLLAGGTYRTGEEATKTGIGLALAVGGVLLMFWVYRRDAGAGR